jgi:hypothetical protein
LPRGLPWLLFGTAVLLYIAAVALGALVSVAEYAGEPPSILVLGTFIAYAGIGALIAGKRPENPIGWLLSAMGVLMQVQGFATAVRVYAAALPGALPSWLVDPWLMAPLVNLWNVSFTGLALLLLLFPTGRFLSPWLRLVLPLAAGVIVVGLLTASSSGPTGIRFPLFDRVFEVAVAEQLYDVGQGFSGVGLLALLLVGAGSMIVRLRTATGVVRQQMKWFAYAGVVLALAFVGTAVAFFSPLRALDPAARIPPAMFGGIPFIVALVAVPVAAGIAILRYRLYDIDVLINRTLVYASLSAILAGTYVASVLALTAVIRPLTGSSDLAVAGSTLAVVAAFGPLRARIQRAVDRRFYRSRYDAARTLDAFGLRLRNEVDLDAVRADLLDVVRETVRPAHASVWLRERAR